MAETTRAILGRIKGIKSTQQITRAMEMVAAVKLNRVRSRAENSRPFIENLETMIRALRSSQKAEDHPLFTAKEEENSMCLVIITSDRGLCGTFNLNTISAAHKFLDTHKGKDISLVCIGKKGNDAFLQSGYNIIRSFPVPWGETFFPELRTINAFLTESFNAGKTDSVHIYFTRFINVLHHIPTHIKLLPLEPLSDEQKKHLVKGEIDFILEPSFDALAHLLVPRFIENQLFHCLIESLTSEQAARMVSMRNATDNAEEMIKELTLSYNKARQAGITKELIDIIGGVEALKGL